MRNPALLIIILVLSSCCKANIDYETTFINPTKDKIELRFFNASELTVSFIEANSTIISVYKRPFDIADSVQVFVKDVKQQTHYARTINKPIVGTNILPFAHYKNLLNMNNYQSTRKELACGGSFTKYTYSF
jgi:hypothetical protein